MLHPLNTVMKVNTMADDVKDALHVVNITLYSDNCRVILKRLKYFAKEGRVLAVRIQS